MTALAFLRATATNTVAPEPPGEHADEMFAAAFRAAVKLRFRTDAPLAAVTGSVRAATRRHGELVPVREAEMLIRSALGEQVPIAEIDRSSTVRTHVLLFAALVEELALTDDELDELLAGL
ncbi:hypothetical protein AB0M54_01785 [Actinoplanes sp. NPDC051470]|uniref:hypothetical protein n=1 Tax=unclassified Actinoplanes TaxID=2626549 RepID=UPI0034457364